ncbi:MAG: extracellular solute-binding protein [Treponema sp.]|nr:extracellular solute-binding protein [Treponema sp.]
MNQRSFFGRVFFKNILVFALIIAFSALSASCRRDETDPNTLTIWCWDPNFNVLAVNVAAEIFRRDNPDVVINVVETAWEEIQLRLNTALSASRPRGLPDIILIQDNAIQKNVATFPNAFVSLDGKIDLSQFAHFKVDAGTINGRSYSVPFDNGASATFLRRDIVEQAGLQVSDFDYITWDRFIELAIIVRERTGFPMLSAVGNENDLVPLMLQSAGTWFFDEQGNVYIANNEVLREAVRIYKELIDNGLLLLVSDWTAYIASLNTGSVAATVNGCWIVGSISAEHSQSGNWAVVSTPRLNIPGGTNYSSVGGSSWMILASSRNIDLAVDFLNTTFAGSIELYETILPSSGAIGTWLPAADSPVYNEPNEFFGGQEIYQYIIGFAERVPRIQFGMFNYEARNFVAQALIEITRGASIDAALERAQRNTEFIINH